MQRVLASLVLAVAALIGLVVWIALDPYDRDGTQGSSGDVSASARSSSRLDALERSSRELRELVERLGERIDSLEEADTGRRDRIQAESPPRSLEEIPAFRERVLHLIEEERTRRHQEKEKRQREKILRRAEFAKGPYGRFNYLVNSMREKLDLDDRQCGVYYETLLRHDESLQAAKRGIDLSTREGIEELMRLRSDLRKRLDHSFLAELTPEQSDRYSALPEYQRAPTAYPAPVLRLPTNGESGSAIIVTPGVDGGETPVIGEETILITPPISGEPTDSSETQDEH